MSGMRGEYRGQTNVRTPYHPLIELLCGAAFGALCVYLLRSILIAGTRTLQHDNFDWGLPIFHFFAESIINGHYPLWNPLSHGGEPFYPLIVSIRLLEPVALLTVYIGQLITRDTVLLFNWTRFIQTLIMAFGAYIVLRPLAVHLLIRLSLMPILLFSSFMLSSFQQDGILYQFVWVPYIAYFLLRIVYYKDTRWHNWLMLAAVTGLNWQSYFFSGAWLFISIFLAGILIFRKDLLAELLKSKMLGAKVAAAAAVLFFMSAPNIVLTASKDKFIYPPRMMSPGYEDMTPQDMPPYGQDSKILKLEQISGIRMPYGYINVTGSFSNIWNFIQLLSPDGNPYLHGDPDNPHFPWSERGGWGSPSEAYMYVGLLPWALALLGIAAGSHDLKKVWLLILASFGLITLGPPGGLHRLLYYVFPPLWAARHMHMFVLFFIFAFLYFYVLGANRVFLALREDKVFDAGTESGILGGLIKNAKLRKAAAFTMFFIVFAGTVWWMTKMTYPATNYLFIFIVLIAAAGWFLRKDLGESGLYAGLTAGSMAIYLMFSTDNLRFGMVFTLFLCLPFLSFYLAASRRIRIKTPYLPIITGGILILAVTGELIYSFSKTSYLYGAPHPGKLYKVKTIVERESPSLYRDSYPVAEDERWGRLPVPGYLPFMYRQSFVFSPTHPPPRDNPAGKFEHALNSVQMSAPLLLKKYAELINMDIAPAVLEEIFAVGRPLFQFKKGFVRMRDADIQPFLNGLSAGGSLGLLREYVLIEGDSGSLPPDRLAASPGGGWDSGPGANEGDFSLNLKGYAYNSLDMSISTNEPGFLYWADGYDGNWAAYINGVEAPIYRANVNFKAVEIAKGVNSVRFVYDNRPIVISLLIFYITFTACILISLVLSLKDFRAEVCRPR